MKDKIQISAANAAVWHHASLSAFGIDSNIEDDLWRCHAAGPAIYLSAINLTPGRVDSKLVTLEALVAEPARPAVAVWDSFQEWDLSSRGFSVYEEGHWYYRAPRTTAAPARHPELDIEVVNDADTLFEFEHASWAGFEVPPGKPASVHHPASLTGGPLTYFLGRVEGEPVAASIACIAEDCVGVYGVATDPAFRGRGYGTSMTWAAMEVAPELPSVLQPSDIARPLNRRLGFEPCGRFTISSSPL